MKTNINIYELPASLKKSSFHGPTCHEVNFLEYFKPII